MTIIAVTARAAVTYIDDCERTPPSSCPRPYSPPRRTHAPGRVTRSSFSHRHSRRGPSSLRRYSARPNDATPGPQRGQRDRETARETGRETARDTHSRRYQPTVVYGFLAQALAAFARIDCGERGVLTRARARACVRARVLHAADN